MTGAWILLLFAAFATVVMLVLLHLTRVGVLIQQRIPDRPHRRMFTASVSFFITFLGVRLLVISIQHHIGPFQYVVVGGHHIHHLVWGILILLAVGYAYLMEVGSQNSPTSVLLGRLFSVLYGVGAALTLDEFALWLNLKDVYWARQGRESIDAIILFGALLAMGTWGAPLYSGMKKRKVEKAREKEDSHAGR